MNGVPVATRRTARSGAKSAMLRASGVPTSSRNRVRVTIIAENMLMSTPRPRVSANPFTRVAPNWSPNHQRIPHVISVETLLSRIEDQARSKPCSIACGSARPWRSSSFIRSKTRMFASTAIPTDSTKPAMPASVIVIGPMIGPSLKIIMSVEMYVVSASDAITPGRR